MRDVIFSLQLNNYVSKILSKQIIHPYLLMYGSGTKPDWPAVGFAPVYKYDFRLSMQLINELTKELQSECYKN